MEIESTENLSGSDRTTRTLVGATLVGLPLILALEPELIAALCLFATYPLVTALIGWDPIVAIAKIVTKATNSPSMHTSKSV